MIRRYLTILLLCAAGQAPQHCALAADLEPVDYQAALTEANSQIAVLSNRAQQLAIQIAQQNREIARLKASAEGATKTAPKPTEPSHP